MSTLPFQDALAARNFITAGRAVFTLRSKRTGTRYTYLVKTLKQPDRDPRPACYVYWLTGPDNRNDYTYLGMTRGSSFFCTKKTKHLENAPQAKGFSHVFRNLMQRIFLPPDVEIWHESRCGRCGRALTDPDSISRGLGPECASYTKGRK